MGTAGPSSWQRGRPRQPRQEGAPAAGDRRAAVDVRIGHGDPLQERQDLICKHFLVLLLSRSLEPPEKVMKH